MRETKLQWLTVARSESRAYLQQNHIMSPGVIFSLLGRFARYFILILGGSVAGKVIAQWPGTQSSSPLLVEFRRLNLPVKWGGEARYLSLRPDPLKTIIPDFPKNDPEASGSSRREFGAPGYPVALSPQNLSPQNLSPQNLSPQKEKADGFVSALRSALGPFGSIEKQEDNGTSLYIITIGNTRLILSREEVIRYLTLIFLNWLEVLIPEVFGPSLPAGGGEAPERWQAEQRRVPWSVLRKLAALIGEHEEKALQKKLREMLNDKLKKYIRSTPQRGKEQSQGNSGGAVTCSTDGAASQVYNAARGSGAPDPYYPSGTSITAPEDKDIPPELGMNNLMMLLSSRGFTPYPDKVFKKVIEALAYRPDEPERHSDKLRQYLVQQIKSRKLEQSQGDLQTRWVNLCLSSNHGVPEIKLLAELLGKSLVIFSMDQPESVSYEHIKPGHYQHSITGNIATGIPQADLYFAPQQDGWLRLRRASQPVQPLFVEKNPSHQMPPVPAPKAEAFINGWAPDSHGALAKYYQPFTGGGSESAGSAMVQRVFEGKNNPYQLFFFSEIKHWLATAGLLEIHDEEFVLSKTLLEFIEGFWMDSSRYIYPDKELPEASQSEIMRQIVDSRHMRADLAIGTVPSKRFTPAYLYTPLVTFTPLLERRQRLFHVLSKVVNEALEKNNKLRVVVFGGMAVRSFLLDRAFATDWHTAIKSGLPAVNDIDLYCNNEEAMTSLLQAFQKEVQPDDQLTVSNPEQVPTDNEDLKILKMKVRFGKTRIFTIDISHSKQPDFFNMDDPELHQLPVFNGQTNEQTAHQNFLEMTFISFRALAFKLASEVKHFQGNDKERYRYLKAQKALQLLLPSSPDIAKRLWVKEGKALFSLLELPPPETAGAPGNNVKPVGRETAEAQKQARKKRKKAAKNNTSCVNTGAGEVPESPVSPKVAGGRPVETENEVSLPSETTDSSQEFVEKTSSESVKEIASTPPASGKRSKNQRRSATKKRTREKDQEFDELLESFRKQDEVRQKAQKNTAPDKNNGAADPGVADTGSLTVEPEIMQAVEQELAQMVEAINAPFTGVHKPLKFFDELFGAIRPYECMMINSYLDRDLLDKPWYPATQLPERLGEMFITRALVKNAVMMVNGRLQIRHFSDLKKGINDVLTANELEHPVALYWHALSHSEPLELPLKMAALKLHQARLFAAERLIRPDSKLYDPIALVAIYRLTAGQKETVFDQHLVKTDDISNPRVSLAIDRALRMYMKSPDDPGVKPHVAAWLLTILSDDQYFSGIKAVMEALGLQAYLPKMHSSKKNRWVNVEIHKLVRELGAGSGISEKLRLSLCACFIELDTDGVQAILHRDKLFDPDMWDKLYRVALEICSPISRFIIQGAIQASMCYLRPDKGFSLLCNNRFFKSPGLFRSIASDLGVRGVGCNLARDFRVQLALLHVISYWYQQEEDEATIKTRLAKITRLPCAPLAAKFWMPLQKGEYFLISPEVAGFTAPGTVPTVVEEACIDHIIPGNPTNRVAAEKLLMAALSCSRARIRTINNGRFYIQVFPEVLSQMPLRRMLSKAARLGNPEAQWLLQLSFGQVHTTDRICDLVDAAQHLPEVRQHLLSELLNPESVLFNPQIIPPLYLKVARVPPGESVRVYGTDIGPSENPDNKIIKLDAQLMEWGTQHLLVVPDPNIQPFPLHEIADKQTRALMAVAMNSLVPLDPVYHPQLTAIGKGNFYVRCYLDLMMRPDSCGEIARKITAKGGVIIMDDLVDPGGGIYESQRFCSQALTGRMLELNGMSYLRDLNLFNDEASFSNFDMVMYCPEFLFNEKKVRQLAVYCEQENKLLGYLAYFRLSQWYPCYLPQSYRCLFEYEKSTLDSGTEKPQETCLSPQHLQAMKSLEQALENTELDSQVRESYVKCRQLHEDMIHTYDARDIPSIPQEKVQEKVQDNVSLPAQGNSEDSASASMPAYLPYTPQWYAAGIREADNITRRIRQTPATDNINPEWANKLQSMGHPAIRYFKTILNVKGVDLDSMPVDSFANYLPALSIFSSHMVIYESITELEQLRSFYFSARRQQEARGSPISDWSKLFDEPPDLEIGKTLNEIYEGDDYQSLFLSPPTSPAKALAQKLAILTVFNRYIDAIEANAAEQITHYYDQLEHIKSLLLQNGGGGLGLLEQLINLPSGYMAEEDSESTINLRGILTKYIKKVFQHPFKPFLVLAGHLATAPESWRQSTAALLIQRIKADRVLASTEEYGFTLAWSPFVYGHYSVISTLTSVLIKQGDYHNACYLFKGVLGWYWKPGGTPFRQFLEDYLNFALTHFERLQEQDILTLIQHYCGSFTGEEPDIIRQIQSLKGRLITALPEKLYQPLLEEIDRYLAFWTGLDTDFQCSGSG